MPSGAATAVEVGLAGAAAALEHAARAAPRARAARASGSRAVDGDRDDLRVVVAGAVVEHDADVAVLPQLHRLAAVRADVREAHRAQQRLGLGRRVGVDAELHEREPVERARAAGQLVLEHEQRAHRVDRGAVGSAWRKTSLKTSSESGPS